MADKVNTTQVLNNVLREIIAEVEEERKMRTSFPYWGNWGDWNNWNNWGNWNDWGNWYNY